MRLGWLFILLTMATLPAQTNPTQEPPGIRLFLSGDVMTGRGIDQVLPHHVPPRLYESYVKDARHYVEIAERASGPIPRPVSYDYIWGIALEEFRLRQPDLKLINLETSITTSDDPWLGKEVLYRMHPGNVPVLQAAGIGCVTLANNHTLDWGLTGLEETLLSLKEAGIPYTGAGLDARAAQAPASCTIGDTRITVFGVGMAGSGIPASWEAGTSRPGLFVIPDLTARSLRRLGEAIGRHANPEDIVIVSLHWGGNWGYEIPQAQRDFAHKLIDDFGADLVHGHSSHHVKGMEVYRGKLILYGCGDLITDYEGISGYEAYRGDLGLLYFPILSARDGSLLSLEMVPTRMERFQLVRPKAREVQYLQDLLNREGSAAGLRFEKNEAGVLRLKWPVGGSSR